MNTLDTTNPSWMRLPWKGFINRSGKNCPSGAVMQLKAPGFILDNTELAATIQQPTGAAQAFFLVNTSGDVADGKPGTCSPLTHHSGLVRFDNSFGNPTFGSAWGARANSWDLVPNGIGVFGITGAPLSLPSRVPAMQMVAQETTHGMAHVSAIPACTTFGVIPTNVPSGNGQLAFPGYSALVPIEVFNQTPFPVSGTYWVKKANGFWLIDRPVWHNNEMVAITSASGAVIGADGAVQWGSSTGGPFTMSADAKTFTSLCGKQHNFLVNINLTIFKNAVAGDPLTNLAVSLVSSLGPTTLRSQAFLPARSRTASGHTHDLNEGGYTELFDTNASWALPFGPTHTFQILVTKTTTLGPPGFHAAGLLNANGQMSVIPMFTG